MSRIVLPVIFSPIVKALVVPTTCSLETGVVVPIPIFPDEFNVSLGVTALS
ncbi:hypothetical protein D3C78_1781220 [compost metagenome]